MSRATAGTPRSGGGSGGGFASPRVTSIPRPPIAPAPLPAVTWASGITPMAMLVLFPLLAVAVSAPFGATILGIVAISQIRQSSGRLYGMPLAIFDTLVYPLLLLDVLIVGLVRTVLTHENASDVQIAVAGLIACAAAIVADVWIVRRVKDAAQTVPAAATAG